jgi:hypothetical protein
MPSLPWVSIPIDQINLSAQCGVPLMDLGWDIKN